MSTCSHAAMHAYRGVNVGGRAASMHAGAQVTSQPISAIDFCMGRAAGWAKWAT